MARETELFDLIDGEWQRLQPNLLGPFTTQTFRSLIESEAAHVWEVLVERYGPGGKGSGSYYSPANILFNYLRDKARKGVVVNRGYVPSLLGWGSPIVIQWELANQVAPPPTEEDRSFIEGKTTLRTHLVRERAAGLRNHLLRARQSAGLSCDICGVTGDDLDEGVREALFEAHHASAPLSDGETKTTRIEDMALLCACCHRLLHRVVLVRKQWVSIPEARKLIGNRNSCAFAMPGAQEGILRS
ncbi:hypothetical protein CN135_30950 [Sinorhizobium meliloti]|uniref:HNH endonuclease n=1 Tax=Sinorhizobium TaxID=28105 RepID=UPI000462A6D5|nr:MULTISPECIES: hypothetical protein [Sinorhizobium]MDX2382495.1 hypothetical protein [Sinorhizobium medicae]RVL71514.1 hypothetical protein CN135_30950 [Sinorhizobium meliloti]